MAKVKLKIYKFLLLSFCFAFAQKSISWEQKYLELKTWPDSIDVNVEFIKNNDVILVDIRSSREQAVSILKNAITISEFEKQIGLDPSGVYVAYCTIGYRSGKFTEKWRTKGIDVLNLEGGVLAWSDGNGAFYKGDSLTKSVHVYEEDWNFLAKGYQAIW